MWADGTGRSNGETLHRAAADAVAHSVLPPIEGGEDDNDDQIRERMKELLAQMTDATGAVMVLCERAITGHLAEIGVSVTPKAG